MLNAYDDTINREENELLVMLINGILILFYMVIMFLSSVCVLFVQIMRL